MSLDREIAQLFLKEPKLVSAAETFDSAEWRFEGNDPCVPKPDQLLSFIQRFSKRDRLTISFEIESEPMVLNAEKLDSAALFLAGCYDRLQVAATTGLAIITINLAKRRSENTISLYSVSAFAQSLKERKLREQLAFFNPVSLSDNCTWVQLFEDQPQFSTKTLIFCTTPPMSCLTFRRAELRAKRADLCHSEYAQLTFVPDDFHLLTRSQNQELNFLIEDLCACASLLFLADVSGPAPVATSDGVAFKINGYKAISGVFERGRRNQATSDDWYKIYDWVYSPGGIADKLGLARNIMSLYWKGAVSDLVESGAYTSILSSYDIYLKQNVKQYIEIKNKLNDYLVDLGGRATKMADGLSDKFEKNITAFFSFFITSILAKVLTDKTFVGVFNRPVAIIGFMIVAGSALHLCLTTYVFNKDRKRLSSDWDVLKRRYSDLLNDDDLQRIIDKAGGFEDIDVHLKDKRNLFVGVWIALLVFAVSLVFVFVDWKVNSAGGMAKDTNAVSSHATNLTAFKPSTAPVQTSSSNLPSSNRLSRP
jgi:hypothetical protein